MKISEKSVVVFDLDDTLYKEADYRKSGMNAVLECLKLTYGDEFLMGLKSTPNLNADWLAELCISLKLQESVKESLIWIYRLHDPLIRLNSKISNVLKIISEKNQIAILTDGRSITQRKKIKALGLDSFAIYVSEEYGDIKPSALRFTHVMMDFPADKYFYIGDNPQKDFLAPNNLGWTTIAIKDDGRNIHPQDLNSLQKDQLPQLWLNSFDELIEFIC